MSPRRSASIVIAAIMMAGVATAIYHPDLIPDGPILSPETSVNGAAGRSVPLPPNEVAKLSIRDTPASAWPAAGVVSGLSRGASMTKAGSLPVWVGPSAAGVAPATVGVEVLDRAATAKAGVAGVLVRVRNSDATKRPTKLALEVDYSGFRAAYGGDWATRLTLASLPDCALSSSDAACHRATSVPTNNNIRTGRLRADTADVSASATGTLFAVLAAPNGAVGSFSPTSLAPSSTWSVGLQSGDLNWSYPIGVPELPGPAVPLGISYSSGALDGQTAATNNQVSWLGAGFDYQPGYIERSFKPCAQDGQAGVGDLCWANFNGAPSLNATMVMAGGGGELVRDDQTGVWRNEADDSVRVELLTGASNGDDDGEYWRVTGQDGTQYYFGINRLPGWQTGNPVTSSAMTVPVFGNDPGEPCHQSTFAASWCQQANRWYLDHVVDRHGDVVSYYYDQEGNYYGRNLTSSAPAGYSRAAYPVRIEYGQRAGAAYAPALARVLFTAADRCVAGSACVTTQPADWPDSPLDQVCGPSSCGNFAPTFFTTKRLASITTQVRSGSSYTNVESWTLNHSFPATGDGTSPSLWLQSIVHSGLVGGTLTLPAVTFDGVARANRVDGISDNRPPMNKFRVNRIINETGGQLDVTYADPECTPTTLPGAPDTNIKRCFPAYWYPAGAINPTLGYFHKQVVTRVAETDRVGGNPVKLVEFDYIGGLAWHYDDPEFTPAAVKTWGQLRGFQKVRVRTGDPAGTQTLTEHLILRGQDGDRLSGGGGRDVWVTDSQGGLIEDHAALRGNTRETIVYNGVGGSVLTDTISEPVVVGVTATRARSTGTLQAVVTDVRKSRVRTVLSDGTVEVSEEQFSYDSLGRLVQSHDLGDVADATDDTCSRTWYAENTTLWITNSPSQVEQATVSCASLPAYPADVVSNVAPTEVLSATRMYYDGSTTLGAPPTVGDATRTDELTSVDGSGPHYFVDNTTVYDGHGRVIESVDALNATSTTAYTPALGGPVTAVVGTNALGHVTTANFDPVRGQMTSSVDANGRVSESTYDALGRVTAGWLPGRSRAAGDSANIQFDYLLRNDAPSVVTTRTLQASGSYTSSYSLLDGFLRERQAQSPSPSGSGRVVSDTFYDSAGRVSRTNSPYFNSSAAGTTLLVTADSAVPGQTVTVYDGSSRETDEIFKSNGVEKWRTTTTYGGNWIAIAPPTGDTATMSRFDTNGQRIELRQYKGATPTGAYDSTTYGYTKAGQLSRVTDPAGNVWRHFYDLRGRVVRSEDPDKGVTTATYDDLDRVLTASDSRGSTLAYTYDPLGRRTGTFDGSTSGTQLAAWIFDTLPGGKGLPSATIRYVSGNAYRSEVVGYDPVTGRSTGGQVIIPASEGLLAGTYATAVGYNAVGQVTSSTQAAVGGLPAETLQVGYTPLGLVSTLSSGLTSYASTSYSTVGDLKLTTLGATGKNIFQTYTFDPGTRRLARVLTSRQVATPAIVSDVNYTYDNSGNVTKIADTPTGSTADTQCFKYDYLRRMIEAWTGTDNCVAAPSVGVVGGAAPYWQTFTYDLTGNRTKEVQHSAAGDTVRDYNYPAAGAAQPHALQSVVQTGLAGVRTDTFAYDSDGNNVSRTVAGVTKALSFDTEGQLATIGQSSIIYDADGNRLIRRDHNGTTLYLGTTELRLSGTVVIGTRYYVHNGQTIAVRTTHPTATLSWLVSDHHNTATHSVDAVTMAVTHRRSTPFGGARGTATATFPGQKGFVGGALDEEFGLVQLGAREYDPATGRFLSVDPIIDVADPQQMHGFAYANNSPVTFTDPDGLWTDGPHGTPPKPVKKTVPACNSACQAQRRAAEARRLCGATCVTKKGNKVSKAGVKKHQADQRAAAKSAQAKLKAQKAREADEARRKQAAQWKAKIAALKKEYDRKQRKEKLDQLGNLNDYAGGGGDHAKDRANKTPKEVAAENLHRDRSGDPRVKNGERLKVNTQQVEVLKGLAKTATVVDVALKIGNAADDIDNGMNPALAVAKQGSIAVGEGIGAWTGASAGMLLCGPLCAVGGGILGGWLGGKLVEWQWK